MKIVVFVFLCFFLAISEETQDHKGQDHNGEHDKGEITIHGTVHVTLSEDHSAPKQVLVFARPVKPNGEKDRKEVNAPCGNGRLIQGDALMWLNFKSYACTYKISVKSPDDGKIKVGASLEKEEKKGKGSKSQVNKHLVEKWSMPLTIPQNHEVGFVLDLRYADARLHINKGIETHSIEVEIEGKVHLKIPKSKRFLIFYHYKVPDTILVTVKSETHPYGEMVRSHKCTEEHVCPYVVKFKAGEEGDEFHVAAELSSGSKSDYSTGHKVPPVGKKVHLDFVLDLTKEKNYKSDKPRIYIEKETVEKVREEGKRKAKEGKNKRKSRY
ncbi:hypothetical protein DdX_18326 [Ditylenchus destructor]|uniref:Uncharacterized protein n=1 Tax=Ditylenchus destructor TaxID=166010 RepID=A0AAD4ML09_9BILA|nr:hypothetical protein DdX_18326 [Ditylenchus destructor]